MQLRRLVHRREQPATGREAVRMADDDVTPAEDGEGAIAPHPFKSGGEGETCAECGRFADDSLHSAASIAAHNASEAEGE